MKILTARRLLAGVALLLALDAGRASAQEPTALTLGGAARLAVARSAGPEVARHGVDLAEARQREQRADLLPAVAGALSRSERTLNSAGFGFALRDPATGTYLFDPNGQVLGPVRVWDLRVTARQSLVDFASYARVRAGQAEVAAAEAEVTSASQQAAAAAAAACVRVLWADAQLSGRKTDSTLAEDLLRVALSRQEAGMGTTLDVTRAQAQLAAIKAQLIGARTEQERAGLELHRALGMAFDAPLSLSDSLEGMPTEPAPRSAAEEGERALRRRGDYLAIEAQLGAAERQLSAVGAERLPAFSLFADAGSTGNGPARLLHTYSWGVQVSIPVFDGLRREARMAEQRSAVRALDVRRRELAEQVRLEVREALLQLTSAGEQLRASAERLELAEQELTLARRRFTDGTAGNADVITAQLGLTTERTLMVDARAAVQFARVALARAEGVATELP